ncbi:MAG: IS1182 family transposase [Rhodomicrobium sp.]|jgi:transposase
MSGFIRGADRGQATMFPAQLEDYVAEDNPVRVIDFFVDQLDLRELGFSAVDPKETGRPAYHPAVMLKIYVYGYLNRVQSSRRLERECQRNVEAMWLTGCLAPDFKTIADFRKDNASAIRKVCREFIVVCGRAGLLTATAVAIDGSKFKAVNSRDRNFTEAKVAKRLEQIEASIERYLSLLEIADRQPEAPEIKRTHLKYKIGRLKQEIERMKAIEAQLAQQEDTQISLTDPDARSMQGTGKATGTVGYNVQCAVEIKNHLIVAHEVTNAVNDRSQLLSMAKQAKAALGAETMEAFADRGYYKAEEVLACEGTGILPYVPKTQTSNNPNRGLFSGQHFIYDAKTDSYTCPAGASLTKGAVRSDRRDNIDQYRNLTACLTCSLKPRCTPDRVKRVKRWQHEGVLDNMQARLDRMPDAMTIRRQTVEHTFGTLKAWMGATHFLTKTLKNVRTEMSLQVLAYNMKRMINMFGVKPLLRAIAA